MPLYIADAPARTLRDIRKELGVLTRRERDKRFRRVATYGLTPWSLNTALRIASFLKYDLETGTAWLLSRRRRGADAPPVHATTLTNLLEDAFLKMDIETLGAYGRGCHDLRVAPADKSAARFVRGALPGEVGASADNRAA